MGIIFDTSKKKEIALYKRVAEYANSVPGFQDELTQSYEETLKKYGLSEAIGVNKDSFDEFTRAKIAWRDSIKEICEPSNTKMKKWRERQVSRCKMLLPDRGEGNVHFPIVYELSSGCSVGCEFCGVGARGLQSIYRYNDENAALFKGVLNISKEIMGESVTQAGLYFATEPLDNPDYEKFQKLFTEINGKIPQITTAVALRNIERTKKILSAIDENSGVAYRFSVRSLGDFYSIMEKFTAEELLFVEVLPQFKEAPGNMFVKSGRNQENDGIETTISCISGFIVNLCDKIVKLTTPVIASKEFPEGMAILFEGKFNTIDEYEMLLKKAIAEKMKTILEPDERLKIYSWFDFAQVNGKRGIISKNGVGILAETDENGVLYEYIYDALKEGLYTRREIGEMVAEKIGLVSPISLFSVINKLWNMGIIYDSSLYGE